MDKPKEKAKPIILAVGFKPADDEDRKKFYVEMDFEGCTDEQLRQGAAEYAKRNFYNNTHPSTSVRKDSYDEDLATYLQNVEDYPEAKPMVVKVADYIGAKRVRVATASPTSLRKQYNDLLAKGEVEKANVIKAMLVKHVREVAEATADLGI